VICTSAAPHQDGVEATYGYRFASDRYLGFGRRYDLHIYCALLDLSSGAPRKVDLKSMLGCHCDVFNTIAAWLNGKHPVEPSMHQFLAYSSSGRAIQNQSI
jgi:hypothetical protein